MYAITSFDRYAFPSTRSETTIHSSKASTTTASSTSSLKKTKKVFRSILKTLAPEVSDESAPYILISRAH